ncbi:MULTISPECIES: ubiquinone biosynthesis accessory factor UbiJ [Massilia]|uniref:ubiquinone biosynthesis accessory factor UbiJ n=1 Tax=Massilia TaxID=149698 RepID=UPI000F2DE69D|nr:MULTISPECIES: SCP2 sterol-binding domain-containing protein [Massilia]MDY0964720.1 sterol-binding protein [Massilia sp. CFBP9026]
MFPSLSSLSPQHALTLPAVAAINHLLAQEAWARALLMRHAGKDACIDAGLARLRMLVGRDGLLEASQGDAAASVTIRVKPADLPLIAQDRTRALSYVKIEGDAEFANVISQLANGLRWDAEHDLERVVGPLGAHRLVKTARRTAGGATEAGRRLAENLAEFLAEERPVLVRPVQREAFAADVVRLRDDVERTAKRIARLEQKLAQLDAATPSIILTSADHHPDRR